MAPIAFVVGEAHEFYPGMLKRLPDGGWVWGGDGREVKAENDEHFFGPTVAA